MAKTRVHELAKELGVESKVVLEKLKEMGEFVKSASSTIELPVEMKFKKTYGEELAKAAAPAQKAAPAKKAPAKKAEPAPAPSGDGAAAAEAPAAPAAPVEEQAPAAKKSAPKRGPK